MSSFWTALLGRIVWLQARRPARRQPGTSLIEYALIVVLVAVVCIGVLTSLGVEVQNVFDKIIAGLQGPPAP